MPVESRTEILDKLVRQVAKQVPVEVRPSTALVSSGLLGSLQLARLLAFLQAEFGVRVPLSRLAPDNFETPELVTDLVVTLRAAAD